MTADWKKDHADACDAAVSHPITVSVIEECMSNLQTDSGLVRYGLTKIAMYAAQVAEGASPRARSGTVATVRTRGRQRTDPLRRRGCAPRRADYVIEGDAE